jgi:SAM-dependent methyltransferase
MVDGRAEHYQQFLSEYAAVRRAQGWGVPDGEYFRSLPNVPPDDPQREIWRRRTASLRVLIERVVAPADRRLKRPLFVVDAGAGNCWLSHRLAASGHMVVAIDVSDDRLDGLGALRWYESASGVLPVVAEFDTMPLLDGHADLVIFNASLHYSTDCLRSVREAIRVLRPGGSVVVMDSPLYRYPASGAAMVREREDAFRQQFGFASDSVPSEHFLTTERVAALGAALDLNWEMWPTEPLPVVAARRVRARLRGRREPASMPLLVGRPNP